MSTRLDFDVIDDGDCKMTQAYVFAVIWTVTLYQLRCIVTPDINTKAYSLGIWYINCSAHLLNNNVQCRHVKIHH